MYRYKILVFSNGGPIGVIVIDPSDGLLFETKISFKIITRMQEFWLWGVWIVYQE